MKINEAEELLGISKANIRFYEKEGLLTPRRGENRYRDYSEEDLDRLREIVILRKLGISVQDIKKLLDGELMLGDAMTANIASLEEQISQLTGALKLSRQIREEKLTKLDTPRYWEIIHAEEQRGGKFFEIVSEYWSVMSPHYRRIFKIEEGMSGKQQVKQILLICVICMVGRYIFFRDENFLVSFLHWPIVFLGVFCLLFPLCLLGKKHPVAASRIAVFLLCVLLAFMAALFVFIIILFFNSRYHFWY